MRREPPTATARYTRWINQLEPDQLLTQVLLSPRLGAKASREAGSDGARGGGAGEQGAGPSSWLGS